LGRRRWQRAEANLRRAVAIYPAYVQAWNELGIALQSVGKLDDARLAFQKAISLDERLFSAYAQLAVMDAGREQWANVAAITLAALKHDPVNWPSLFFYDAVANYNLGHLPEAEQSARRAIALDAATQLPRAHYILGRILAVRGDSRAAAEEMSKYLELLPNAADAPRVRAEIRDATARSPHLP